MVPRHDIRGATVRALEDLTDLVYIHMQKMWLGRLVVNPFWFGLDWRGRLRLLLRDRIIVSSPMDWIAGMQSRCIIERRSRGVQLVCGWVSVVGAVPAIELTGTKSTSQRPCEAWRLTFGSLNKQCVLININCGNWWLDHNLLVRGPVVVVPEFIKR